MAKKATAGEKIEMDVVKKRETVGERLVRGKVLMVAVRAGYDTEVARVIDAAIRRAVKEAWNYGEYAGRCDGHKRADMQDHIEKRYGVKL